MVPHRSNYQKISLFKLLVSSLESEEKDCVKKLHSTISTGKLNTSRYVHRPPINLVVYKGSLELALNEILS